MQHSRAHAVTDLQKAKLARSRVWWQLYKILTVVATVGFGFLAFLAHDANPAPGNEVAITPV